MKDESDGTVNLEDYATYWNRPVDDAAAISRAMVPSKQFNCSGRFNVMVAIFVAGSFS